MIPIFIIALSAGAALQAQALQLLSLSPQGEVAQVWRVVARFDEAMYAPEMFGEAPNAQSKAEAEKWNPAVQKPRKSGEG